MSDILKGFFFDKLGIDVIFVLDISKHGLRNINFTCWCHFLQPGGDINSVPKHILILKHNFSFM